MIPLLKNFKLKSKTASKSKKNSGGSGSQTAIGIDISQNAVRMVQLTGSSLNQIELEKYAVVELPKHIVKGNKVQDYDQLSIYIEQAYAQLRTSCKNFIAALPYGLSTFEQAVYNPKETGLDLEGFTEAEISQIFPIEEANYDCQIIGKSVSPVGEQVLLVASRKEDAEPFIEMFDNIKMGLSLLDLDILAQYNAYTYWINHHARELTNEKIAVFGLYDTQMYAMIMQNGQILYKQENPVSIEQLNQLIQNTYQVTEEKAAHMMKTANPPSDYAELITDTFNIQIAQEIERIMQLFYASTENFADNIKHILLTGILSEHSGLVECISGQSNTPAQCVHPVEYIRYDHNNLPNLKNDAASLTLAFGLALRGL